jgi:hypothetical protein
MFSRENFANQAEIIEYLHKVGITTFQIECQTCGFLAAILKRGEILVRNDGCVSPQRTEVYQCVVQAVQEANVEILSRQEPPPPLSQ